MRLSGSLVSNLARCAKNNHIRSMASSSEAGASGKPQAFFEKAGIDDFLPLMDVFVNDFGPREPMGKEFNLSYEDLCHMGTYIVSNGVRSGVSLKLVDKERDKIVGFLFNTLHTVNPKADRTSPVTIDLDYASDNFRKLFTIVYKCRDISLEYGKAAGWKKWMNTDAMYIDPAYSNNGQNLSKKMLHLLGSDEELIAKGIDGYAGEVTSTRSLKMSTNDGFIPLKPVPDSVYKELGLSTNFHITPVLKDYKNWKHTKKTDV